MKESPNPSRELPTEEIDEPSPRVGLLGELEVELQIVQQGWHPVRLDTAQMASNADLLAVNEKQRVSIQVKTTDAAKQNSKSFWLFVGYATGYLKDGKPFFNAKKSPLIADVVIAVSYLRDKSRFVVMPVAFAEELCKFHCEWWAKEPTKVGGPRALTFPIWLPLTANRRPNKSHYECLKRNVLHYENAWHVLKEDVEKLHDAKKWPLI